MQCPHCRDQTLIPEMTRQGVEIDRCGACGGIWLDRGEIFHFTREPMPVAKKLEEALRSARPGTRASPRTGRPMMAMTYPGGPEIDHCLGSKGLWLDGGELEKIVGREGEVRIDPEPRHPAPARQPGNVRLMALPNLALRSVATLAGLYGVLTLVLITVSLAFDIPLAIVLAMGLLVSAVQFVIGPWMMDLSLRWLYRLEWVEKPGLPEHLVTFVAGVCQDKGMKFPRFGIIDDGAPQAFTYGHRPNNAHIVVSRGLLEILAPDEARAVVAHEIGHAVHWDMFLMTVAQLVPLFLYFVYRMLLEARGGSGRTAAARIAVAVGAYVLYLVSEYVVLWFSRTREYHADRFAGTVTGDPRALASALVKVAYGLAGRGVADEERKDEEDAASTRRSGRFEAIGALGIFDPATARGLAIATYAGSLRSGPGGDKDTIVGAMRWDLWNPWAGWYEINSTHPLTAKRLLHLSNQAEALGREPYVVFDEQKPESYWDEFLADLGVHLLPWVMPVGVVLAYALAMPTGELDANVGAGLALSALGLGILLRFGFVYEGKTFPEMSVAALLKKVKVSAVRPVPCTLSGTIIGRGVPGYIFSEDFVMEDDTGIIFLDYRQPFAFWELLFGLLKGEGYQGKAVTVEGWYRRAPVPYVEIRRIWKEGQVSKSWAPAFNVATAIVLVVAGFGVWLVKPFT